MNMLKRTGLSITVAGFLFCFALATQAASSSEQIAKCRAYYDEEIKEIDDRIREKYSADEGERLRDHRRELKSERAKTCR